MKKRILSLLLLLSFLLPMFPAVRAEEKAAEVKSIEAQIRAYADSMDQSDAVGSAAAALAIHGITMGGRKLSLKEDSALAAVLMNSELTQVLLHETCIGAIEYMQIFELDCLDYVYGQLSWHPVNPYRDSAVYLSEEWIYENCGYFFTASLERIDSVNAYDEALEWIGGSGNVKMRFSRKTATEDTITYQVECLFVDRFDFSTSTNSGFKKWMSGLGELLFREFDWEVMVSFELKIPNFCCHSYQSYHWSYDAENALMNNDASDGFAENETAQHTYVTGTGRVQNYYELEKPMRLLHTKPWVLEYQIRGPGYFAFPPLKTTANQQSYLVNYGRLNLGAWNTENVLLSDDEMAEYGATNPYAQRTHHYGTELGSQFSYESEQTYTIRLENHVQDSGSNMVYVTVYDENRNVVLNVPMDDYYLTESWGEEFVLQSTDSDGIRGQDFMVGYIGNQNFHFSADYFDLRVWENGADTMTQSAFSSKIIHPTCTESGGIRHTCALCGYSYDTNTVPAYGHSFGDWYVEKAAVCAENGQERRDCADCGAFETHEIPAPGHDYAATITAPTCTEGGFTTYICICGDSYIADATEALGHDLTEWTMTEEPTCLLPGTEEQWCQRCELRESRSVDALGHDYESVIVEPGCTVGGHTLHTCTRCEISYRSDFTSPTGHSCEPEVTPATCTEGGYTTYLCACGYSYRSNFTVPMGHELGEWTVTEDPTCTEDGSESRTCSRCDYSETRITNATGHNHNAIVTAPTCTEQGFTTYLCTCGDFYISDYTDALGHDYIDGLCTRCGAEDPDYEEPVVNPFTDVPEDSFYFEPVLWAVEKGITSGTTATTFSPNDSCMRAHVVTFLWRAAGSPAPEAENNPFVDVKESDFYYNAVLWAVEKGITTGADATHFNPFGICNRAQVVTFLHRAFGSPAVENAENPFNDVPADTWYAAPVLWAVEKGITNGLSADTFGPDSPCNRAQVVTFLYRAYN